MTVSWGSRTFPVRVGHIRYEVRKVTAMMSHEPVVITHHAGSPRLYLDSDYFGFSWHDLETEDLEVAKQRALELVLLVLEDTIATATNDRDRVRAELARMALETK